MEENLAANYEYAEKLQQFETILQSKDHSAEYFGEISQNHLGNVISCTLLRQRKQAKALCSMGVVDVLCYLTSLLQQFYVRVNYYFSL